MNRGLARGNIFETDDHRETFIGLFADLQKRFGIEVHSCCLMENHYHLLLHTPRGNLSRGMRHLNGLYTQYMNRALNRDGPLMKGRYKPVLVDDDVYLLQVSRYIHINPIGPGLAKRPEDYRW
jgi:putative transposase